MARSRTACVLIVLTLAASAAEPVVPVRPVDAVVEQAPAVDAPDAISIPRLLSYQGRLADTLGNPVPNGTYSVVFRLYSQPSGGSSFWNETQNVTTKDGLFSILLGAVTPVGSMPDAGAAYLGMAVGGGAELAPRLRLASSAYAYLAERAAGADLLQGRDTTAFVRTGQANSVTSAMIVDANITAPKLHQMGATTGQVLKWTGSAWAPRNDSVGGGTGDNAWTRQDSVLFTVNRLGIARGGSGNLLYGNNASRATHVNLGVACTTGQNGLNREYATVSGGVNNSARGNYSTVGGGTGNTAGANHSSVVGGDRNTSSGGYSSIGGGGDNQANGSYSSVGGGYVNVTMGGHSAIAGGADNTTYGHFGAIGGGWLNTAGNTAADSYPTVAGGRLNSATGRYSSIGGGRGNIAAAPYSAVLSGYRSLATDTAAVVCGGDSNYARGRWSFIGGGRYNKTDSNYTVIGGGALNVVNNVYATVGGGMYNTAGRYATVGGGYSNTASGQYAAVSGGDANNALGLRSVVGGGYQNKANASHSIVVGGLQNFAGGEHAFIGGGQADSAGYYAAVVGGANNNAAGRYSAVPGGQFNRAVGNHSLAAGCYARANHRGSFVWSDSAMSASESVYTTDANQFRVRARGGTWFYSNSSQTTGVTLASNSNAWASTCDSLNKEDFREVDRRELLEKLAALRVRNYKMKDQDDGTRHIGPVAQDFHAAFGVGENNTSINMADADGVLFAAVQALYEQNLAQQAEIEALKAALKARR
jgi:hypothetical protein